MKFKITGITPCGSLERLDYDLNDNKWLQITPDEYGCTTANIEGQSIYITTDSLKIVQSQ